MRQWHLQRALPFLMALLLPAALAWYYDVFVNWQQKLYPLAIIAAEIGIILLTLSALRARGEPKPLALLWKTALSMAVFTAVLVGVTAVLKDMLHLGAKRATATALSLLAVQVIVLYILLLRGQRASLGKPGLALAAAALAVCAAGAIAFMWSVSRSRDFMTRSGLAAYELAPNQTAIYFLSVHGDAILLESGGHFALIDAGEDSEDVLDYIKWVTRRTARGLAELDFILGTHAHSDHIGGFDTLILDPDIAIGRAYLKPFVPFKQEYKKGMADRAVYDQMLFALEQRGVPLIQDIPEEPFALGDFTLTFFGGGYNGKPPYDENDNSVGLLVEACGQRAFLAADMNNYGGRETRLAPQIGKVDLVKSGHHGGEGSNTKVFANTLAPQTVISTAGAGGGGHYRVQQRYLNAGAQQLFCTGDFGGIAAVFSEDGIDYYAIGTLDTAG